MNLTHCEFCPRRCGVDRLSGEQGFCRAGADSKIYRYGAHHGEEPPLSGSRGSGTVFFSRCTLRCIYCQNHPWSQEGHGSRYTSEGLAQIFCELRDAGCHNWNLVSPTPWIPQIRDALSLACREAPPLPVVYNTSGFERVETLAGLEDGVDLYLTDLRYASPATAEEGSGRADLPTIARQALLEMWRQKGALQVDSHGIASRGVICRLLILPGHANEVIENLQWLAETIGPEIAVSVMSQYTPAFEALTKEGWTQRVTQEEFDRVAGELDALGFDTGWIQELDDEAPPELIGFTMKPGSCI